MFENLIATRAVPGIEGFKVDVDRQEEIAQAVGVRTVRLGIHAPVWRGSR